MTARIDTDAAAFLRAILPERESDERYRLEVFPAPPGLSATSKNYLDVDKLAAYLVRHGQERNAYVALATFPADGGDREAEHALRTGVAWADLDVGIGKPYGSKEGALAALERFHLPPSCVVDSGNGLHVYWVLDEPADDLDRVLAIVRGLARVLPGDPKVALKSQVMRVPGTFNHKAKNPRPLAVKLLSIDEENTYSIDAFADAGVPEIRDAPSERHNEGTEATDISGLPVGTRGWKFIAAGAPNGAQRSEAVAVARSLVGAGYSVDDSAGYIWKGLQASPNDPRAPWTFEDALAIAQDIADRPAPPLQYRKPRAKPGEGGAEEEPLGLHDDGNGRRFVRDHGDVARYVPAWKQWLINDRMRWAPDQRAHIRELAKMTARSIYLEAAEETDEKRLGELLKWARQSHNERSITAMLRMAESSLAAHPSDFDSHRHLFNYQNGTMDLRTVELRDHDPADMITRVAAAPYLPGATHPILDRFLATSIPDPETRSYVQRAAGSFLSGESRDDALQFLHGPGGTGKSSLVAGLVAAMGDYAATAAFDTFAGRRIPGGARPEVAALDGPRLVVVPEIDSRPLDVAFLKQLVSGETITTRRLYADTYSFQPQCTVIFVGNERPRLPSNDSGAMRRIREVPFNHVVQNPDPEVRRQLRDASITGAAVLAWAVEGHRQWAATGLGSAPEVDVSTADFKDSADPLAVWIEDSAVQLSTAWTAAADLRASYEAHAQASGEHPVSGRRFAESLRSRGFLPSKQGGTRGWQGIALKTGDPLVDGWTALDATSDNSLRTRVRIEKFLEQPSTGAQPSREQLRDEIRDLAEAAGWPSAKYAPHLTVVAGAEAWSRFLDRADVDRLCAVREALLT